MNQINPIPQKQTYTFLSPENQALLKEAASFMCLIGATWAGLKYGVYRNPAHQKLLQLAPPSVPHLDADIIRRAFTTLFPAPKISELPLSIPLIAPSPLLIPAASSTKGIDFSPKFDSETEEESAIHSIRLLLDKNVQNAIFESNKTAKNWRKNIKPYLHREDFSPLTTKMLHKSYSILGKKCNGYYRHAGHFRQALNVTWDKTANIKENIVIETLRHLLKSEVLHSVYHSKTETAAFRESLHPYIYDPSFDTSTCAAVRKAYLILGRKEKNYYPNPETFELIMQNALIDFDVTTPFTYK